MKLIFEIDEKDLKKVMHQIAMYDESAENDWDKIKEIPEVIIDLNVPGIENDLGLSALEFEQCKFTYALIAFSQAKLQIKESDEEVDGQDEMFVFGA